MSGAIVEKGNREGDNKETVIILRHGKTESDINRERGTIERRIIEVGNKTEGII